MESVQAVAKVTRLFGPDGTLAVVLYDAFPVTEPDFGEPLYAIVDSLPVPLFLERFERRGRAGALVRFSDLETVAQASLLLGCELYDSAPCGEVSGPESDYGALAGYRAVLAPGTEGVIESVVADEANPLFVVNVGGREVLVPVADEFISDIDDAARTIVFSLPEGLLELYLD